MVKSAQEDFGLPKGPNNPVQIYSELPEEIRALLQVNQHASPHPMRAQNRSPEKLLLKGREVPDC